MYSWGPGQRYTSVLFSHEITIWSVGFASFHALNNATSHLQSILIQRIAFKDQMTKGALLKISGQMYLNTILLVLPLITGTVSKGLTGHMCITPPLTLAPQRARKCSLNIISYLYLCGYADFGLMTRTTDPEVMKNEISKLTATGGGDAPEMCLSGLQVIPHICYSVL